MTSTTPDRRTRRGTRARSGSATPTPDVVAPVVTGVARGNLGTGTAVDDETTVMAVPEAPAVSEVALAPAPAAQPARDAVPTSAPVDRPSVRRRDPYRPIGIALAAVLVTLAGIAVLSGGEAPAQVGAPPAATEAAPTNPDGALGGGGDEGNGNGQGNCNGHGNDPCDREGGGGD